jgi:hypothetical protein
MESPGNELLSRTALAQYQNGNITFREFSYEKADAAEGLAPADEAKL